MTETTPDTIDRDYRTLVSSAGIVNLDDRTRIEVIGTDRARLLHNLCTADIRGLEPGAGCEAFFTDARGHIVGHTLVLGGGDRLVLETVAGQEEALLTHLNRYVIREQVELFGRGDAWGEVLIAGASAAGVLGQVVGTPPPADLFATIEFDWQGGRVSLSRVDFVQSGAWLAMLPRPALANWCEALLAAGGKIVDPAALAICRVEAGWPWYDLDFDQANLPQELGRDERRISFKKGCYLGQETVARIDALGHVNKHLLGVRFAEKSIPERGTALARQGQLVGNVTSSVWSPKARAPLALAWVKRGHTEPGTRFESPAGEAEVVSLPLAEPPVVAD